MANFKINIFVLYRYKEEILALLLFIQQIEEKLYQ